MTDEGAVAVAVFVTFIITASIGACCTETSKIGAARDGYQQGCVQRCRPITGLAETNGIVMAQWKCRCVTDAPVPPMPAEAPASH